MAGLPPTIFKWYNPAKITWTAAKCKATPGCNDEGGIDLTTVPGEPITAVNSGKLIGAGPCQFAGGGSCGGYVVAYRTFISGAGGPDQLSDVYVQHLSSLGPGIKPCQSGNCSNQWITTGQTLGYAGSITETGINPPWYGVWGPNPHPGDWIQNPEPLLTKAIQDDTNYGMSSLPGWGGSSSDFAQNPIAGCAPWDIQCIISNLRGIGIKIGLFILAVVLVILGGYILFQHQINSGVKTGAVLV